MPDLPDAAPDHAAVLTLAESLPDGALKRGLVALLAERQQAEKELDETLDLLTKEQAERIAVELELSELAAERQQDKERIERLKTALFQIATCLDVDVSQVLASRALAVEEDATP